MIQAVTTESDCMDACGEFFENIWQKQIFCKATWFCCRLGYVCTTGSLISARKLAEVAGHGILIILGGGRMLHFNAFQSTLVEGSCTRVARFEAHSLSNVENLHMSP